MCVNCANSKKAVIPNLNNSTFHGYFNVINECDVLSSYGISYNIGRNAFKDVVYFGFNLSNSDCLKFNVTIKTCSKQKTCLWNKIIFNLTFDIYTILRI